MTRIILDLMMHMCLMPLPKALSGHVGDVPLMMSDDMAVIAIALHQKLSAPVVTRMMQHTHACIERTYLLTGQPLVMMGTNGMRIQQV